MPFKVWLSKMTGQKYSCLKICSTHCETDNMICKKKRKETSLSYTTVNLLLKILKRKNRYYKFQTALIVN